MLRRLLTASFVVMKLRQSEKRFNRKWFDLASFGQKRRKTNIARGIITLTRNVKYGHA
jgi:hypothetical protein